MTTFWVHVTVCFCLCAHILVCMCMSVSVHVKVIGQPQVSSSVILFSILFSEAESYCLRSLISLRWPSTECQAPSCQSLWAPDPPPVQAVLHTLNLSQPQPGVAYLRSLPFRSSSVLHLRQMPLKSTRLTCPKNITQTSTISPQLGDMMAPHPCRPIYDPFHGGVSEAIALEKHV